MLYNIKQNKLFLVQEKKVTEKQVENLVGENLDILALEKVCYQFEIDGKRIVVL